MPVPLDRLPPRGPVPPPIALVNRALERSRRGDEIPLLRKAEPRLLFAATSFTRGVHALRRAHELASRSHGTLYVLQVSPTEREGTQQAQNQVSIARAALRSVRKL